MVPSRLPRPTRIRGLAPLLALALVVSASAAGCASGSDHPSTMADATPATPTAAAASGAPAGGVIAAVEVPIGAMTMPTQAEVSAAWAARPEFVKALPAEWQGAYSFALARPDVLQWLPCYCGCAGIEHRSNLDCFFVRREVKGTYQFEEHGSYCDICVRTANLAQQMLRDGSSMVQIRAAVDAQLGGGAAPGTDTPMPPAT
jgi:hypothetical protein